MTIEFFVFLTTQSRTRNILINDLKLIIELVKICSWLMYSTARKY